ncbi:aldehyde dehydrogenase family protein, partial [Brevibacterium sediminis]
MTTRLDHFIAGEHRAPAGGEYLESTNPATLETLYEFARGDAADIASAVETAQRTFESSAWQRTTPTQRGHLLRRFGDLIGQNADELARFESQDNGKLLREMNGQLKGLPEYLYYYAGLADKVQGSQIPTNSPEVINFTQREALGVVGLITPWNSPMTLTISKLAPALAAGNTTVVKPSEYTSRTILRLAELADEAGFPPGAVHVVP